MTQHSFPADQPTPPTLQDGDWEAIERRLAERERRRTAYNAGILRIKVDGKPREEFDASRTPSVDFAIEDDIDRIEVFGEDQDGELLLAVFSMAELEVLEGRRRELYITQGGGQQICLRLLEGLEQSTETALPRVRLLYRETRLPRMAALWRQRWRDAALTARRHEQAALGLTPTHALRVLGEAARVLLVRSLLLFVGVFYFYPAGLWRAAEEWMAAVPPNFCFAQDPWPRWQVLVQPVLIGYVIWQLLASIIIILVSAVSGVSLPSMLFGVISGTSLSSIGNLACGLTLGVVGSTAGGALIAIAFGIAFALLVNQAGMPFILGKMAHTEVLPAVMGGLVGIVAPPLAMVGFIFLALALTSYVIGNAAAGQDERLRPRRRSLVVGAVAGTVTSGILRGLIMGVTPVVGRVVPDMVAFLLVFGSVGSVVLGTAVYWRSGRWMRSVLFGGLYLLTLCSLILMAFTVQRGTPMGLIMNGMAQALFQGTFFILAFMVAERFGGPWAGAVASGLDGAIGFSVFVVVTHWQVYLASAMSAIALSSLVGGWIGLGFLLLALALVAVRRDKGDGRASWLTDAAVTTLGKSLPPLTLGLSLTYIVFALTRFDAADAFRGLLWIHRIAVGGLGSFLLLGQYLQIEGWMKARRGHGAPSLAHTYRRFRLVTELIPAPTALLLVLSGLALMYHAQYALSRQGWLFYLVTFWAFFFGDGILGYLPRTRQLLDLARAAVEDLQKIQALRAVMRHRVSNLLMLVHFLSFPCVVYLGYFKPHVPHPLGSLLLVFEHTSSPLLVAVGWIGIIVGTVFLARRYGRLWLLLVLPKRTAPPNIKT